MTLDSGIRPIQRSTIIVLPITTPCSIVADFDGSYGQVTDQVILASFLVIDGFSLTYSIEYRQLEIVG
jgi:hypothetical protein